LADAFQFSGLKDRCLTQCRHPAVYLLCHYRRGALGAFNLGWSHGLFCLGCCWAMMLVMFAAGVADLRWMGALGAVMTYEKVGSTRRHGEPVAATVGVVALILATLVALHPTWLPRLFASA
jgi:predicted metal-binding membrane protein